MMRPDGVPTDAGRARAAKALLDERRWELLRADRRGEPPRFDGLTPIDEVLTPDQLRALDARLGPPAGVSG
jgi:manganese/zinc/iron transport system permease protein